MENLTTGELWTAVLAVASAIVLLSNAAKAIANAWQAAKAPNTKQDKRLTDLENWRKDVDRMLNNDKEQIKDAKECNHVLTKGMLALLEHGINGNNIDQMRDAKNGVEAYLINH